MATITFKGNPTQTSGDLPATGAKTPDFSLVSQKLEPKSLTDFAGKRLVLNIVPSVDTGICAMSARKFNERAASLEDTVILTISVDLPFAMGRFCAAEGIEQVEMLSGFRADFGDAYGVGITDGPFAGLYARAIVVTDADHNVIYTELVPEIAQEPDYDSALAALS